MDRLPFMFVGLEQLSRRCTGISVYSCGFSLKKSHVERIFALYGSGKLL
jgi:hypothetical protein